MRLVRVTTLRGWLAGAAIALTLYGAACTLNPQPLPPETATDAGAADANFAMNGDAGRDIGADAGATVPDASGGVDGGSGADGGPPAADGGDGGDGQDAGDGGDGAPADAEAGGG